MICLVVIVVKIIIIHKERKKEKIKPTENSLHIKIVHTSQRVISTVYKKILACLDSFQANSLTVKSLQEMLKSYQVILEI